MLITKTKTCFKCGTTKELSSFYKHPRMRDGRLNKCKECTRRDVAVNYRTNRDYYIAYEKQREQSPSRKQAKLEYQRTRRRKHPQKNKARQHALRAVRNGTLPREPCQVCGAPNTEAHHTDHTQPLTVIWLCRRHHLALHGKTAY